jgi:hypothetical protein
MIGPSQLASLEDDWNFHFKVGEMLTGEVVILTDEDCCRNQRGNVQSSSQVK